MRVVHLNCGSLYPPLNQLADGFRSFRRQAPIVAHCLLVDTGRAVILIDSGIGLQTIAHPEASLGAGFLRFSRPKLDPAETAFRQLERHGYAAGDVRHVVLTHLDADHAGGIADFPHAKIHVQGPELRAATARASRLDRTRYRPALWAHEPAWEIYEPGGGQRWFGFDAVRPLHGLPDELLMVPLPGHAPGHTGIAVDTGQGWLLHAGDAYNLRQEIEPHAARPNAVLRLTQLMQGKAYRNNQNRLRELQTAHCDEITIFSAHDPAEFRPLASQGIAGQ